MTTATQHPIESSRLLRACEIRAVTNGSGKTLTGYAAVFNSPSEDLGGFIEVVKPGAFTRALKEKQDVRCLPDHDDCRIMGRIAAKTLTLSEDSRGLHFECPLPDTQPAKDLVVSIERGDIVGCSFRFRVNYDDPAKPGARWLFTNQGPDVRELLDVDLIDVGPCSNPAYLATDVSARSYEAAKKEAADRTAAAMRTRNARLRLAEAEI